MTKKKKQEKDLTEQELLDSLNRWSRKMFGYTKNGKYYRGDSKQWLKESNKNKLKLRYLLSYTLSW